MILKKFSSSSSQQDVSLGGLDKSKAPETSATTTIMSTTTGSTTKVLTAKETPTTTERTMSVH